MSPQTTPTGQAAVLAVTNQKGGVGKSTTVYHLASAAVHDGLRVLAVDLDPQGNLTASLAREVLDPQGIGVADALSHQKAAEGIGLADVLVPGLWDGLDLAPTTADTLGGVRDELTTAGLGREKWVREALAPLREDYDLILIDCPPALDQLSINALSAADRAVIVTQSRQWSLDGLAALLRTIDAVRTHTNPALSVAGVIVNLHEPRTAAGQHWLDELAEVAPARGLPLLSPPIPKRALIADAVETGTSLHESRSARTREIADLYTDHLHTLTGRTTA
nr:partitioning protein [Kocuria sp.]